MSEILWEIGDSGKLVNQYLPVSEIPEAPLVKPYPKTVWRIDPDVNGGNPSHDFLSLPETLGAFRNAKKLTQVRIPESVKNIGAESFRFTALETVKIAADCQYSEKSFPENCKVEFYGSSGDHVQLYDSSGSALLDREGARIYVKKQALKS